MVKVQIKYYEDDRFIVVLETVATQLRMNRSELIRALIRLGLKKLIEIHPEIMLPSTAINEIMETVNKI